jgi:protein gp37
MERTMNKSTGNMYDFVTHTWNPVKGKCSFECSYCYVGKWKQEQKPIHLDEKELNANLCEGNFIFVCSGCDLFADDVPKEWICRILDRTDEFPKNKYLIHTKNPEKAMNIDEYAELFNDRMTLCVTIETNRQIAYHISNAPPPIERAVPLNRYQGERMITIEPILDFDVDIFSEMILYAKPQQVNIGADSGRNNLPEPSAEKIGELIKRLELYTKVHLKKSFVMLG